MLSKLLLKSKKRTDANRKCHECVQGCRQGRRQGTEKLTFSEMVASPIHILQGLSEKAEELFKHLGVHTVSELAEFKYARWAEAIVEMSKYENTLTETERKVDRELHKLE